MDHVLLGITPQDRRTPSNIFTGFHRRGSCLTAYKYGSFTLGGGGGGGGGGGLIYPILLLPNICELYLLWFYTIVSLDFGRGPISKLTTHSPRMVNNSIMYPHSTRRDVTVHMKCNHVISCDVMLHA